MTYKATNIEASRHLVAITCTPGWLGRLFGRQVRTVYAFPGRSHGDVLGWFLPSGRSVSDGMQDAIDELSLTIG